jgi:hypothetical protein
MLLNRLRYQLKDRKRRPEEGEWEPQISFKIFDRYPKNKPQKQTHAEAICSRANQWPGISGDDQEVLENSREHTETSTEEREKTAHTGQGQTVCGPVPDCLQ